jgi:hypothetical protein
VCCGGAGELMELVERIRREQRGVTAASADVATGRAGDLVDAVLVRPVSSINGVCEPRLDNN